MRKIIYLLCIAFMFSGCEELSLLSPEGDLVGSWKHTRSGAAAGGDGSMVFNGTKYKLDKEVNNRDYDLTFGKKGVCDCLGFDQYKVSGNTITLTNSFTKETYEYDYSIVKDGLALFEKVEQWKREDPGFTSIDYAHNFDKQ